MLPIENSRRSTRRLALPAALLTLSLLIVAPQPGAAESAADRPAAGHAELQQRLSEQQLPVMLEDGKLTGAGGEQLLREAESASYFLIGENHGIAEVLDFTHALYEAIYPLGYHWYVTEVGPISSQRLSTLAAHAKMAKAFVDFYQRFPFAIPFAVYQEEVDLLRKVLRTSPVRPQPILGIDQEFFLSVPLHLLRLEAMSTNQQNKAWLRNTRRRELQNYGQLMASGDPSSVGTILNGDREEAVIERLRILFPDLDSQQREIVEAIADSRDIYRAYAEGRYADNNNERAELMKKYFARWYDAIIAEYEEPRFLFKLGANHVARGLSVLDVDDIGNAVAKLADGNDQESFHLLVMGLGGHKNAWLPFLPDETRNMPLNPASSRYAPLLSVLPQAEGWQLYDLRPLHDQLPSLIGDDQALVKLLGNYDAILAMDEVSAATLVPQGNYDGYAPR